MKKPGNSKQGADLPANLRNDEKAKFRCAHPHLARRSMEKFHAGIGRILEEKNFKDIDEANAFLESFINGGKAPDVPPRTPLEAAQDIMFEAWDEPSKKTRIRMARRALEVSADCADAYVLLAEEAAASSVLEEKEFYEKGVQAGERAIGARGFQEDCGHFWAVIETRPYMRARAGLAGCLLLMGQRGEAIRHFQDMLRLNPDDNQGLRYLLVNLLIEEGRDREARELIDRYPNEPTAAWAYTKALLKFKREGPNAKTDRRLMKALDINRFVPLYLLGLQRIPKKLPETIGFGNEDEAVEYAAESMRIWPETAGAVEWLKRVAMEYVGNLKRPADS